MNAQTIRDYNIGRAKRKREQSKERKRKRLMEFVKKNKANRRRHLR